MDEENNITNSSDSPLEPWVDPALEARLVALVLGEASDFEVAELQGAIESQPELRAFYDRIQNTHEALKLAESPTSTDEPSWQLPTEKREALLEQFRSPADKLSASDDAEARPVSPRSRFAGYSPWLGIAAAVILLVVIVIPLTRRDMKLASLAVEEKSVGKQIEIASSAPVFDFIQPNSPAEADRGQADAWARFERKNESLVSEGRTIPMFATSGLSTAFEDESLVADNLTTLETATSPTEANYAWYGASPATNWDTQPKDQFFAANSARGGSKEVSPDTTTHFALFDIETRSAGTAFPVTPANPTVANDGYAGGKIAATKQPEIRAALVENFSKLRQLDLKLGSSLPTPNGPPIVDSGAAIPQIELEQSNLPVAGRLFRNRKAGAATDQDPFSRPAVVAAGEKRSLAEGILPGENAIRAEAIDGLIEHSEGFDSKSDLALGDKSRHDLFAASDFAVPEIPPTLDGRNITRAMVDRNLTFDFGGTSGSSETRAGTTALISGAATTTPAGAESKSEDGLESKFAGVAGESANRLYESVDELNYENLAKNFGEVDLSGNEKDEVALQIVRMQSAVPESALRRILKSSAATDADGADPQPGAETATSTRIAKLTIADKGSNDGEADSADISGKQFSRTTATGEGELAIKERTRGRSANEAQTRLSSGFIAAGDMGGGGGAGLQGLGMVDEDFESELPFTTTVGVDFGLDSNPTLGGVKEEKLTEVDKAEHRFYDRKRIAIMGETAGIDAATDDTLPALAQTDNKPPVALGLQLQWREQPGIVTEDLGEIEDQTKSGAGIGKRGGTVAASDKSQAYKMGIAGIAPAYRRDTAPDFTSDLDADVEFPSRALADLSGSGQEALGTSPAGVDNKDRLAREQLGRSIDQADELAKQGKFVDAREKLEKAVTQGVDPSASEKAKSMLARLGDAEFYNKEVSPELADAGQKVERFLSLANGHADAGRYEEAEEQLKGALSIDKYNETARRGIEELELKRQGTFKSARDHMRGESLAQVDQAWEWAVPTSEFGNKVAKSPKPGITTRWDRPEDSKGKRGWGAHGGVRLFSADVEGIDIAAAVQPNSYRFGLDGSGTLHGGDNLNVPNLTIDPLNSNELSFSTATQTAVLSADDVTASVNALLKGRETTTASNPRVLTRNNREVSIQSLKWHDGDASQRDWLVFGDSEDIERIEALNDLDFSQPDDLLTSLDTKSASVRNHWGYAPLDTAEHGAIPDQQTAYFRFAKSDRARTESEATPITPAPKKAAPDLSLETLTSAEPFSTFSLNVSDVSFKLASVALLENNAFPDAAKVRVEEFVNSFDYGDPPTSLSEKISCQLDQAAHPFLQQRNLMRVSMRTAAEGRAASQPLRLTIVLDRSGSMERADREESVLRTMQALAKHLGPADKITAIAFARQPHLITEQLSGDRAGELVQLVAATPSEGGTNLEEALQLADTLATRQFDDSATNRIVLITDGAANLGDADPESLKEQIVELRQRGIAFDACGVGADGLNDATLEALTRKGDGRYYFLNRPEDADASFVRQLAGSLRPAAKNVKVQVKFNPDRVTRYRLAGFEKHRLKKEDFRNDKVDAAEMAAAESGNALYQFEADPQGSGDVGEVFVRFLDTSTQQMVERSWPIPYQPKAPRLEEASPAMQLAATAGLLGEKLKGGPAAESIKLDELTPITNQLRTKFDKSERVQQLIQMVEKARSLSK